MDADPKPAPSRPTPSAPPTAPPPTGARLLAAANPAGGAPAALPHPVASAPSTEGTRSGDPSPPSTDEAGADHAATAVAEPPDHLAIAMALAVVAVLLICAVLALVAS